MLARLLGVVLLMFGLARPGTARAADEPIAAGAVPVQLEKSATGWRLVRAGRPYFICGAGGTSHLELLAECGGNSIRTWHVRDAKTGQDIGELLDRAHRLGLTVCVGFWLGHERHGFNYHDAAQTARQLAELEEAVRKYRDHPAVLLWGIGNEMEGYEAGDKAAVWSHVNACAEAVKRLDPHHPCMTVIAGLNGARVASVHRHCPAIDIVGINSYGDAPNIPTRYRKLGGTKPYIVTEFGPAGVWESAKNAWGVVPEPTSTAKAAVYRRSYESAVRGEQELCLGSYAFLLGNKFEATATWFGLTLPDGSRTAALDVLQELWTGEPPQNRCPRIDGLSWTTPDRVGPGTVVAAQLAARDEEGDELRVEWVLQAEPKKLSVGGDGERPPPTYPDAIVESSTSGCRVRMPDAPGGYRLYVYLRDGQGGAACGNLPILVEGNAKK